MIAAMLLLACQGPETTLTAINDNGSGNVDGILGRVCDPETATWLEGAVAYTHLFRDGELYDTRRSVSDIDGYWNLSDLTPEQTYTVYIQYGSEIIDQREIYIPPSGGIALDEPDCGGGTGRLAVVSGNYDDLGRVLEGLGYGGYEAVNGNNAAELAALLSVPENLVVYDAILFSGGHIEEDVLYDSDGSGHQAQVDAVIASLQAYVDQGGILIATDWSYDLIEAGWPEAVDWYGDDLLPDDAQRGEPGTVNARVDDADLASTTGLSTAEVRYDLPSFPVIETVGADTTIYLSGAVAYRDGMQTYSLAGPMTVGFNSGEGEVLFSNWRFDANAKTEAWDVLRVMLNQRLESAKEEEE
ncbi:MAG: hypothetical protein VX899_21605 [Myxococcota bacterium]|nr:hypothetical protein [Myxococcota bacterium]